MGIAPSPVRSHSTRQSSATKQMMTKSAKLRVRPPKRLNQKRSRRRHRRNSPKALKQPLMLALNLNPKENTCANPNQMIKRKKNAKATRNKQSKQKKTSQEMTELSAEEVCEEELNSLNSILESPLGQMSLEKGGLTIVELDNAGKIS